MCVSAAAAGVGMQAVGSMNAAKGEKAALAYQAAVSKNNAKIAGWQADDAIERGKQTKSNIHRATQQVKGAQIASIAARGDFFSHFDVDLTKINGGRDPCCDGQRDSE